MESYIQNFHSLNPPPPTPPTSLNLETVRDPSEFHFYGIHGNIADGVRVIPSRYLKIEVAKCPSTSCTCAHRMQSACIRAPFDEEVHGLAPCR